MTATTADGGGGAAAGHNFPVILNDGGKETHIGNILVTPNTNYKTFQTTLITAKLIKIPPNQFTIFLKHKNQPHRKIPISSKINFPAILHDPNYYFLVHKTTKPIRAVKKKKTPFLSQPSVVLLRRGEVVEAVSVNSNNDDADGVYEMRKMNALKDEKKGSDFVCEECSKGNNNGDEFHWCVRDAVVSHRFLSPAGPISRPTRTQQ